MGALCVRQLAALLLFGTVLILLSSNSIVLVKASLAHDNFAGGEEVLVAGQCPYNCSNHGQCNPSTQICECAQGFGGIACQFGAYKSRFQKSCSVDFAMAFV